MTIDERLEKLAERHRTLAQFVEHTAILRREWTQNELANTNRHALNTLVDDTLRDISDLTIAQRKREQRQLPPEDAL